MIKTLKYAIVGDVKEPNRAHKQDAGADLFVPNDFKPITLKLGDSVLIPSGLKFEIPDNYMLRRRPLYRLSPCPGRAES